MIVINKLLQRAVLALIFFASCSQDDISNSIINPDTYAEKKIQFESAANFNDITDTPTLTSFNGSTGTNLDHTDFAVFAAMTDQTSYNGTTHHFNWMYQAKIKENPAGWIYESLGGDYFFDYWNPDGLHSFFAFAPYDAIHSDNVHGFSGVTLSPASIETKVTPKLADFHVPTNSIKQGVDLMYASAMNIEGNKFPSGGIQGEDFPVLGKVLLPFYHALAQVSFDFKLHDNLKAYLDSHSNDYVEIRKVGFIHVKNSGTFSFYSNGQAEWVHTYGNTSIVWGGNDEGIFESAQWSSLLGTANTISSIPHTDTTGKTYIATMIPQEFTESSAIVLEYYRHSRRDQNGGIFTITYPLHKISSLPVSITGSKVFKQGENYKFTITIDNGEEAKFLVQLTDWVIKQATLPL